MPAHDAWFPMRTSRGMGGRSCIRGLKYYCRYGVARSYQAAQKQVNTGQYKPKVSKPVYLANTRLDADKDGTACEVTR